MRVVRPKVEVATSHVEVVMVDVNDFCCIFVDQSVWERPPNDLTFCEIDRAFVVNVVQLNRADQWDHTRRIDVISYSFFDHRHVVTLRFVQKRNTALDGSSAFESPPDFVVARRIHVGRWPTCG